MENVKRDKKGRFIKGFNSSPNKKKEKVKKICLYCGKTFLANNSPSMIKRGGAKFCNRSCLGKFYIYINKPYKNLVGKPAHNKGTKYPQFQDEKNPGWKGDSVGIKSLHRWVYKHRGAPTECEHCGTTDTSLNYEWANVDHSYKRKLDDFIRLCRSCHRIYDIKVNGYVPPNLK